VGGIGVNVSLIIKDIPLTSVQDIQSLVMYNRNDFNPERVIGLAVELYNSNNDPNLETPLSSTNEITTTEDVYRYDFPAIDTYPAGDYSNTDSTTQIASDVLALKEVVSEFAESVNITGGLSVDTITTTGNVDISGSLSVDTITTTGNVDVGGFVLASNQPSFKVSPSITETITGTGAGIYLPYDIVIYDTTNSYNTTNYQYTIPVSGNYFFYYSCGILEATEYATSLRKNDVVIDRSIIKDVNLLTNDNDTQEGKGMAVANCAQGDIIKVTCNGTTRACTLSFSGLGVVNSFGGFLIG